MPLKDKWRRPKSAREMTSQGGQPKMVSLTPPTTNAEAGIYDPKANQGRGAGATATKEYGAEAVRLLGMIAGHERSDYLSDRDREFVRDMRYKAQTYGSGFVCSQGQVHWLRDIKDRLVEKGEV